MTLEEIRWRLKMAWYILRGHTVVYRATIRDGGLDLTEGKSIVRECSVLGANAAVRLPDVPLEIREKW